MPQLVCFRTRLVTPHTRRSALWVIAQFTPIKQYLRTKIKLVHYTWILSFYHYIANVAIQFDIVGIDVVVVGNYFFFVFGVLPLFMFLLISYYIQSCRTSSNLFLHINLNEAILCCPHSTETVVSDSITTANLVIDKMISFHPKHTSYTTHIEKTHTFISIVLNQSIIIICIYLICKSVFFFNLFCCGNQHHFESTLAAVPRTHDDND